MKGDASKEKTKFSTGRRNGRGGYRGRGRGGRGGRFGGRDRGRYSDKQQFHQNSIQCHYCQKFGHKEADCWSKQRGESKKANFAEKMDTEETLFMAHFPDAEAKHDVWLIDSGCSNPMCNSQSLFEELDVNQKSEVRLGDNKKVQVEGKGTIAISTSSGKKKLLHGVFFVPNLAHNLLSVGQLMCSGLVVVFDDGHCIIRDKKLGYDIVDIGMKQNRMFPLDISTVEKKVFVAKECSESDLWHLR